MSPPESHARVMDEIFRSDVAVVTREPGFIRLRRTSRALRDAGVNVAADFTEQFRFLVPLRERKHLGFLLDSREAPMIGDDSVFMALAPVMAEMTQGFSRVAILVQTALGKLQATRRSRDTALFGPSSIAIFDDEVEAIAFMTGQGK